MRWPQHSSFLKPNIAPKFQPGRRQRGVKHTKNKNLVLITISILEAIPARRYLLWNVNRKSHCIYRTVTLQSLLSAYDLQGSLKQPPKPQIQCMIVYKVYINCLTRWKTVADAEFNDWIRSFAVLYSYSSFLKLECVQLMLIIQISRWRYKYMYRLTAVTVAYVILLWCTRNATETELDRNVNNLFRIGITQVVWFHTDAGVNHSRHS